MSIEDSVEGRMTVSEAVQLTKEMDDLLAYAAPKEREWLQSEMAQDPYYKAARLGVNTLRGVLGYMSWKAGEYQSAVPRYDVVEESEAATEELLADLDDDHELITAQAEQQKKDIADIHSLLDSYEANLTANGGLTKSQRAALKRHLNGEYKSHWSANELADDPMRLKNIMDSIVSKTGISETTRADVQGCILEKIKDYVVATANTVDPDVISRRIEASLLPGSASLKLQKVLLESYFRSAEMYGDVGLVLDSYEKFVRGAVRLASKPEVLRQALRIASFETTLLPENGLFAYKVKAIPMLRLDQPELFGRTFACLQGITILMASLDALDEIGPPRTNPLFKSLAGYAQDIAEGTRTRYPTNELSGHYNRLSVAHASVALNALGEEEFYNRFDAIDELLRLYRDPEKVLEIAMSVHDAEQDEAGIDFYTSQAKYITRYLIAQKPELADFYRQIFETDYVVSSEVSTYIGDQTLKGTSQFKDKDFMTKVEPALRKAMGRVGGKKVKKILEKTDDLHELLTDVFENHVETVSRPTGDGYVVEVFVNKGTKFSDENWLEILDEYHKQIEKAKKEIARTTGVGRRAVNVGDSKSGSIIIVRAESLVDKQKYHPIDGVIGEIVYAQEKDIQALTMRALAQIEASRVDIMATQRRFLNSRGISWQTEVNGDKLVVSIHKHPRNPRNFICEVMSTEGPKITEAKVLMNAELMFELGDRKVRDKLALTELNALAAEILTRFMCQEVVESEEGEIGNEKNTVTARIAHLRLLHEGQRYSYDRWAACLEIEGLDLEVLSDLQQIKYGTNQKSTYVKAVERDDINLGPLRVYFEL